MSGMKIFFSHLEKKKKKKSGVPGVWKHQSSMMLFTALKTVFLKLLSDADTEQH